MEEIAIVANEKDYAKYLKDNLDIYFNKYSKICCYDLEELEIMDYIKEKYIVIPSFSKFQQVRKKTRKDSELIIADLTLNKKYIDRLYKLPKGTRALLVNIHHRSCMEVITMIYNAGFKDLELVPFYIGASYDKSIKVAITPSEIELVPEGITTVIDIGQRVIDMNTIIEISDKLNINIDDVLSSKEALVAKNDIIPTNYSIEKVLGDKEDLTVRINVLMKLMDQGILITDTKGKIYLCNDKAKKILKSRSDIIVGFNIIEILPEVDVIRSKVSNKDKIRELINIEDKNIVTSITQIISNNEVRGNVISLEDFTDLEHRQHKMRTKITGYGHVASYTFSDILGNSKRINELKEIAKRMACSDSSIVIYGESGTGKELFAQSIHNYSKRSEYNFVAVNCSALPENLLESELYGYEDGAFSGAKKGGKIGLFELAHEGTIFLDEIGEIPLPQQAKLLRVIEEKKIMKVGGKDLIDINVRIIVATNKDLFEMVSEGKFRGDLYYRLNVLPINIPSLREREEDILLLFNFFLKKGGQDFSLSQKSYEKIIKHSWPGNIRELKNTVEYLANLNKKVIECEDIPIKSSENKLFNIKLTDVEEHIINQFKLDENKNLNLYEFILIELQKCYRDRVHVGRKRLEEITKEKNLFFTEQEIKNGLIKLNSYGFVISSKGRKGSNITELGIKLSSKL